MRIRLLMTVPQRLPLRTKPIISRHERGVANAIEDEMSGMVLLSTREKEGEMDDRTVRLALERHWDASDANDFNVEHEIYREDAVLDYPQSGERIRGRHNIQESRTVQPNKKRFTVQRMIGSGDLWVSEFMLSYDGVPSCTVSLSEFGV